MGVCVYIIYIYKHICWEFHKYERKKLNYNGNILRWIGKSVSTPSPNHMKE